MKKNSLDKSVFILIFILVILIATVVVAFTVFRFDALTSQLNKGNPLALLFTVSDGEVLQFADLLLYHPGTKKAGIYYYPPNLGARLETLDRVDAVSVLYKPGEPESFINKIQQLSGVEIGFYLDMDLEQLSRLVDQLEGLELFISNPVDLVQEDRPILIPSGSVVLDGDKIVDYLLFDEENEEVREKVWRRQKFLQALLTRMGEKEINEELLTKQGFEYLKSRFKTNITLRDLRAFVLETASIDVEHIVFQRVEGKDTMVEDKLLVFPYFDGSLVKRSIEQMLDTVKSSEAFKEDVLNIRLEILNGTTRNGLAGNTGKLLEGYGFEVLQLGNAERNDFEHTLILDRKGRQDVARHIADILSCTRLQTQPLEDQDSAIDVTIIIGRDFDGKICKD